MQPNDSPKTNGPKTNAPPAPNTAQEPRESIPVQRLYFASPVDMPGGKPAQDALIASARSNLFDKEGKRTNAAGWLIDYLPWFRHHRVTYYGPGGKGEEVRFVHEGRVRAWDPVR